MRKKIKQLMNKEDGFTLVELLAVIVILGIILAIAIPSVGGVINRAQDNADAAEKDLVVEAARMYAIAEYDKLEKTSSGSIADSVTGQDLMDWGYLEKRDDSADTTLAGYTVTITGEVSSSAEGATNTVENLSFDIS